MCCGYVGLGWFLWIRMGGLCCVNCSCGIFVKYFVLLIVFCCVNWKLRNGVLVSDGCLYVVDVFVFYLNFMIILLMVRLLFVFVLIFFIIL